MDRAHHGLEGAELLAGHGFAAAALSRAYYAAFYAVEDALTRVGVIRSKHSGVVSAVGTILVRQHGPLEEAIQAVTAASTVVTAGERLVTR